MQRTDEELPAAAHGLRRLGGDLVTRRQGTFPYTRILHLKGSLSLLERGRCSKSLETHQWRRQGRKAASQPHPCSLGFAWSPPIMAPTPTSTSSLDFGWRWCLRWLLGPFVGVTQFSWVSPMYIEGVQDIKLLFVPFPINLLFITGTSQQRTKKSTGKMIFLPIHPIETISSSQLELHLLISNITERKKD